MNACVLGLVAAVALGLASQAAWAAESSPSDKNVAVEKTSQGDLTIQPINHSAIRFAFKGKQYYVDRLGRPTGTRCQRPTPSSSPTSTGTT